MNTFMKPTLENCETKSYTGHQRHARVIRESIPDCRTIIEELACHRTGVVAQERACLASAR